MKEKPIIFNTEMVKAIIAGNKTQTRRVIKPQPDEYGYWLRKNNPENGEFHCAPITNPGMTRFSPYEIDQILWVRETWCLGEEPGEVWYKANVDDYECFIEVNDRKWKPSIYMPREAARLYLKVKDIRIERIQEITLEDIQAEGIILAPSLRSEMILIADFVKLWDSINKKRGYGWDKNPNVWVYDFKVIKE